MLKLRGQGDQFAGFVNLALCDRAIGFVEARAQPKPSLRLEIAVLILVGWALIVANNNGVGGIERRGGGVPLHHAQRGRPRRFFDHAVGFCLEASADANAVVIDFVNVVFQAFRDRHARGVARFSAPMIRRNNNRAVAPNKGIPVAAAIRDVLPRHMLALKPIA